eukprot:13410959-Heterocapsa_arctica.AAC.1
MELVIPKEKRPTIMFIGMLKAESNWVDLTVKQKIWTIGQILTNNRTERLMLLRLGAIRLIGRRSEGGHNGRATSGSKRHGIAENEDGQEFQNQC